MDELKENYRQDQNSEQKVILKASINRPMGEESSEVMPHMVKNPSGLHAECYLSFTIMM